MGPRRQKSSGVLPLLAQSQILLCFLLSAKQKQNEMYNLSGFSFSSMKWRAYTGLGGLVLKAAPWWLNLQTEISLQMCDAAVLSCGLKTGHNRIY